MWGIIPAAGSGTRIQPLAFSKELLPVGSFMEGHKERPRAISEYLIERMAIAGVNKIAIVISPEKTDIIRYYGNRINGINISYVVQPKAAGLCDAIFRPFFLMNEEESVLIGLPDTVWFPDKGLCYLPEKVLSFLLFPVDHPELYDSVDISENGDVCRIRVKDPRYTTNWIWGAFKMPGTVYKDLRRLWLERDKTDEFVGTLINSYIDSGGLAKGIKSGTSYVDVGTLNGYREAITLLSSEINIDASAIYE